MNRPEVSIMLPARDAATTLTGAVDSCLAQTWTDFELLLIANDSTPETLAVMERFARQDRRIRVVASPAGAGFVAALNQGWQEARGRYLARMDADDVADPRRLTLQVALLEREPDLAACGTGVRIRCRDGSGRMGPPQEGYARFEAWLNAVVTPDAIERERFIDSPIANPTALIRRELFGSIGGYREVSWAEDYDFWLRALEAGQRLGKVDEVLLDWIDSETRLTRNDPHYGQDQFLAAKAHFLGRMDRVKEEGVSVCGAGPIGKRMARLLAVEGVVVHAFHEVHPRRLGQTIGGVPVRAHTGLAKGPDAGVVISAVGLPGVRSQVRAHVSAAGFIEGRDFFCVA